MTDTESPPPRQPLLSKARLEEIKRRCEAASPGPWTWIRDDEKVEFDARVLIDASGRADLNPWLASGHQPLGQPWCIRTVLETPDGKAIIRKEGPMVLGYAGCGSHECESKVEDRVFIAAARQDIPDLLAEVADLRARLLDMCDDVDALAESAIEVDRDHGS